MTVKSFCSIFLLVNLFLQTSYAQQTPEQKYFDWTNLQFSKQEYAHRRQNMLDALKNSGGGVFLAPARDGRSHGETFRQLNDFLYFTGLELPNSILALDAQSGKTILFAPWRDVRFESSSRRNDFPGRPLAEDPDLKNISGISMIRAFDEIESAISEWIASGIEIKINFGSRQASPVKTDFIHAWSPEQGLIFHLQQKWPNIKIDNVYSELARLRMIKSPAEITAIRKAANLTMQAIREAAQHIKNGTDERGLEAELEAVYKRGGAQRLPFASIIKSGPNSLWPWRILAAQYDRRNRRMQNGELVIFDVGCELNYYVSDVGRTFPVSGEFNLVQKQALEMQLRVSNAIIAATKPGVTFADLYKIAQEHIPEAENKYMQVGDFYGHHIGLDTGDPSLRDVPLQPGMVFTVEPWYYNHDQNISVFIEDVILVTETGAENLTATLPRTPDELEKMVGEIRVEF